jgi:hypothetical protein
MTLLANHANVSDAEKPVPVMLHGLVIFSCHLYGKIRFLIH